MDATDRIVEEFNRLVALGRVGVRRRPLPEQFVYYIVAVRCEIDMNGFADVFTQCLNADEVGIFLSALDALKARPLADEFRRAFESIQRGGFYDHGDWERLSPTTVTELDAIQERVGDQLWELDGKLLALLEGQSVSAR